jgi:N-acetylglucosamine-6-phosphate deacetylase
MPRTVLIGNIVLPDRVVDGGAVVIDGERIAAVLPSAEVRMDGESRVVDYRPHTIAPGLIDLHLHGARGHDVMDGNAAGLAEIAAYAVRCGVTGFVPTTLAAPWPAVRKAVEAAKAGSRAGQGAEVLGIYLEAPFLNVKKKGAQNPEFIRPVEEGDVRRLAEAVGPLPAIITVAPEVGGNLEFVPAFRERGWVVSIGHSEAAYELAVQSFERGITQATHLYNAMSGFLPRDPGVIGAVLDSDGVTAELIADGIHVHPAALRLAVRQKGADRVCLVTDSVKATGLGDGNFKVGGLEVVVKDGQARLREGGALAGSVLTLNRAVRNIIRWTGVPMSAAVRMASLTPARVLRLDREIGSLEKGKLANLAIFDERFNAVAAFVRGGQIWGRSPEGHPAHS